MMNSIHMAKFHATPEMYFFFLGKQFMYYPENVQCTPSQCQMSPFPAEDVQKKCSV